MKTLTTEQLETLKTMDWQDDRGEDLTGALLYFSNTNDSYFQDITGICVSCLRELLGDSNTMTSFYWEIAYRYHKKNALSDAFYDLHYAIWCKGDVVKDGVIQEFDADVLGLFTKTEEKPTGTDWQNLLSNVLENALKETDVDSIVEFIDNNFADVSNKIRENFSENLEVDDIGEGLKDDIAKDWIEQNYSDAFERAMRNMDSYEIKDQIIDYLQDNL